MIRLRDYIILLLCLLINLGVFSQRPIINGKEENSIVSNLKKLYSNEDFDSLLTTSNQVILDDTSSLHKGFAYYFKALVEADNGRIQLSFDLLDLALEQFSVAKFKKGEPYIFLEQADILIKMYEIAFADSLYNIVIEESSVSNAFDLLSFAHIGKAQVYLERREYGLATQELREAFKYSEKTNDLSLSIDIVNQLSTNFHTQGELDSAILYFNKGLQLKLSLEEPEGIISDYCALGNLFKERGDYGLAQQQLINALALAEKELDSFSMTSIYLELGDIYGIQKVWDIAEDYYKKSIHLAKAKNSRFMEAGCLRKLGEIYQSQNKLEKAIEYYESSLNLYTQLNNKIMTARLLVDLSQIYNTRTQYAKVKGLLEEALSASTATQDVMTTLKTQVALAEIEIKLGNISKGITIAEKCIQTFKMMADKQNAMQVNQLLSEAYSKTGNYRKALKHHQIYSTIKDSLLSIEKAEALKKYDLLVTTKRKNDEIAKQNEQIQNQEFNLLKKNNQLIFLAGGLTLVILIAIFLFYIFFKNKELNKQKISMLKQEQETQRMKAIIAGEENERKRFARELHDGLGAVLATVKMQLSTFSHSVPELKNADNYHKAEALIDEACTTVREISHNLMPYVLEQQGLISAVEDLCLNISNSKNITIDYIPFGEEELLNDIVKITVYRITQELLKNIIKHAQADEVIVQLTIEDDKLILIVEDDGIGFDLKENRSGIGIKNIRSRTDYLNGDLDIYSVPNKGTTFTIEFPIEKNKT